MAVRAGCCELSVVVRVSEAVMLDIMALRDDNGWQYQSEHTRTRLSVRNAESFPGVRFADTGHDDGESWRGGPVRHLSGARRSA
jgi:hypothetical protein